MNNSSSTMSSAMSSAMSSFEQLALTTYDPSQSQGEGSLRGEKSPVPAPVPVPVHVHVPAHVPAPIPVPGEEPPFAPINARVERRERQILAAPDIDMGEPDELVPFHNLQHLRAQFVLGLNRVGLRAGDKAYLNRVERNEVSQRIKIVDAQQKLAKLERDHIDLQRQVAALPVLQDLLRQITSIEEITSVAYLVDETNRILSDNVSISRCRVGNKVVVIDTLTHDATVVEEPVHKKRKFSQPSIDNDD
jgi:hypothetical protein